MNDSTTTARTTKAKDAVIPIGTFIAAIETLRSDPYVADSGVWYHTQKEHWLGWLGAYLGPGGYDRKTIKDDAKYAYNHIVNYHMLQYLAWACRIPSKLRHAAHLAMKEQSEDHLQRRAAAFRRVIPWDLVRERLWPEPSLEATGPSTRASRKAIRIATRKSARAKRTPKR